MRRTNIGGLACVAWLMSGGCIGHQVSLEPQPLTTTSAPRWIALNIPQSELPLPAVVVGTERQPSGGCFKSDARRDTVRSVANLVQTVRAAGNFESGLKAKFLQALIGAQVDADLRRALELQWKTEIRSAWMVQVDPAMARPDLANEACRVKELNWLTDRRTVLIAGLAADSFTVRMGQVADAEQRAGIEAAIQRINSELGLAFRRASSSESEITYSAPGVFFGALTTELSARSCSERFEITLRSGDSGSREICGRQYVVTIVPSAGSSRYTVNVHAPDDGLETGELDIAPNASSAHALGENRLVSLLIQSNAGANDSARKATVRVSVLQVGVSG